MNLDKNVSYLNLGSNIDSIEEQIKSNPLSSWHMSHEVTSFFCSHLDNSSVNFNDKQLGIIFRRMSVTGHVIYLNQFIRCRFPKLLDVLFGFLSFNWTLDISLLISEALLESFFLCLGWHFERWFWILCSIYRTRIISITNDSSKSHGYNIQTVRKRRTSSWRSICLYPGKNGRWSKNIENSQIGVSRHLDSCTTTQMA